jgi:hypothetical protein
MRNISLILLLFAFSFSAFSNDSASIYPNSVKQNYYPTFIGTSTGINNLNGMLGFFADINVHKNFNLTGGVGMGAWGWKTSLAGRFYRNYPRGTYYSVGLSSASGLTGIELEMETTSSSTQNVKFDLYRVMNLNLSMGYQFMISPRFRFHLDFGYAVNLTETPYKMISTVSLTDESEAVMKMMVPGGVIFGLGFSLGI